jgi:hypothetical protein
MIQSSSLSKKFQRRYICGANMNSSNFATNAKHELIIKEELFMFATSRILKVFGLRVEYTLSWLKSGAESSYFYMKAHRVPSMPF